MLSLLQNDGAWLVLGLVFLALIFLARARGARGGMGCCGGYGRGDYRRRPQDRDVAYTEEPVAGDRPARRDSGSCH